MSKFCYEGNELRMADCQCEFCAYYNNGKRSEVCPDNLLESIIKNEILCPEMKDKDLSSLLE